MSVIHVINFICNRISVYRCEGSDDIGPERKRGPRATFFQGLVTFLLLPCKIIHIWSKYKDVSMHKDCQLCRGNNLSINMHASLTSVFTHFFLYSSLSRLTLANTLYRALSSGVMVSIWTPTPSGCDHDNPGPRRVSKRSPCFRTWVKLQMVPGNRESGPSVCTATSRA